MEQVTILIPTKNRQELLFQSLGYYQQQNFEGQIIIGDSSDMPIDQIQLDPFELNILLKHYPKQHDGAAMKDMVTYIKTPYAIYTGDDDIAVMEGLKFGVEYLDYNTKYTGVGGIKLTKCQNNQYNATHALDLSNENPIERMRLYIRTRISPDYYLQRTEVWQKAFQYSDKISNRWIGREILPCILMVLAGKIKDLGSVLTIFRLDSLDSWDRTTNSFNVIFSKEYVKSLETMTKIVIKVLCDIGTPKTEAEEVFTQEMWLSTIFLLMSRLSDTYPKLSPIVSTYADTLDAHIAGNKRKKFYDKEG